VFASRLLAIPSLLAIAKTAIIIHVREPDRIKECTVATAVECEHCGQRYSVREDLLGKRMKCEACGQTTAIVAAPPRAKGPAELPTSEKSPAAPSSKRSSPRKAEAPAKAHSRKSDAPQLARRTDSRSGGAARAPHKAATTAPHKHNTPAPAEFMGASASAPAELPAAKDAPNLLDLLGDSAFSAAGTAPASSGVVLKAGAPPPIAESKPKAKKRKKKKSGSGELSDNTRVLLRMSGGAILVLLGLFAIGRAIYAIVSRDDENAAIGFLVGRWILGGVSSISGGLKLICG
jgi:hypothetical protein